MSLLINADKATLRSFARSQLGFTLQDMREKNLAEAILQPEKYVLGRNDKKSKAEDVVTDMFETTFNALIKEGYLEDYAKKLAFASAQNTQAVQFGLLNDQYPDIINNLAQNQASNKVLSAANPLYRARGASVLNVKRKSHRKKKSHKKKK